MYGVSPSRTRASAPDLRIRSHTGCFAKAVSLAHEPNAKLACLGSTSGVRRVPVAAIDEPEGVEIPSSYAWPGSKPSRCQWSVQSLSEIASATLCATRVPSSFETRSTNEPAADARAHTL